MSFGISGAGIQATVLSAVQGDVRSALTSAIASLGPKKPKATPSVIKPQNAARITFEYLSPTAQTTSNPPTPPVVADVKSATQQRPAAQVANVPPPAAKPPPLQRNVIALDLTLAASDAIAEQLNETLKSRQATHPTAAGFYVDEWGMGPGALNLVARVIFGAAPDTQIQKVRSWFQQTKRITPFAPGGPGIVRMHDSYSGISLQLNLQELSLNRSSDEPLRGLLTINAEVIADLTQPQSPSVGVNVPAVAQVAPASSLLAYQTTQVTGTGAFAGTTAADLGVA